VTTLLQVPQLGTAPERGRPARLLGEALAGQGTHPEGVPRHGPVPPRGHPQEGKQERADERAGLLDSAPSPGTVRTVDGRVVPVLGPGTYRLPSPGQSDHRRLPGLRDRTLQPQEEAL
jgi:hypothetical protein